MLYDIAKFICAAALCVAAGGVAALIAGFAVTVWADYLHSRALRKRGW